MAKELVLEENLRRHILAADTVAPPSVRPAS